MGLAMLKQRHSPDFGSPIDRTRPCLSLACLGGRKDTATTSQADAATAMNLDAG